jgi:reactive intermediate/imine deaminase
MTETINTSKAPAAIGTYSQAIQHGDLVFLSGQIPLQPDTMELVSEDFTEQADQVFSNIQAVCEAAGGGLADILKLNIYLADLADFGAVNDVMSKYFDPPYPARAAVQVSALPRDARIEIDGIMAIPE